MTDFLLKLQIDVSGGGGVTGRNDRCTGLTDSGQFTRLGVGVDVGDTRLIAMTCEWIDDTWQWKNDKAGVWLGILTTGV